MVSVTNATGSFIITPAGLAGRLAATVTISPTLGASFTGNFSLAINTTSAAVNETVAVGATTLNVNLPAGPYLRVEGADIVLTVASQTLKGNFAFEQITRANNVKVTRVAASNVSLSLGDGTTNFVSLTQGEGYFLATAAGLAGRLSGTVSLNVPGVVMSATLAVELNNTSAAIDESFVVAGVATQLVLPAGPYVKVSGTNISLTIDGQKLKGDFTFQQQTVSGQQVVKLTLANVYLGLGDGTTDFVSVSNGSGQLTITAVGISGNFSGTVAVNVPSVTFAGSFSVAVQTDSAVLANNFVRVSGTGITLTVAGQTLSGNFVFEQSTNNTGAKVVRVGDGLGYCDR